MAHPVLPRPPDDVLVEAWHSTLSMQQLVEKFDCPSGRIYKAWSVLRQQRRIPRGTRKGIPRPRAPNSPPEPEPDPPPKMVVGRLLAENDDDAPRAMLAYDPLLDKLVKVHGTRGYGPGR